MASSRDGDELNIVVDALGRYRTRTLPAGNRRRSAVLAPLREGPDGLELLFIMRPASMRNHAGQPAFPGGLVQDDDGSRWETALRETHEEIGIEPTAVRRLGQLDDYITFTGYHVTPCVGLVSRDLVLAPNPGEVERTFAIPVCELMDERNVRTMATSRGDSTARIYFFLHARGIVWGATGAMVANFLEVYCEATGS